MSVWVVVGVVVGIVAILLSIIAFLFFRGMEESRVRLLMVSNSELLLHPCHNQVLHNRILYSFLASFDAQYFLHALSLFIF